MMHVELRADDAVVRIAPVLGAAITSFAFRDRPVLRAATSAALAAADVRLTSCYPLVPYSNRIRDARLRFRGSDYALSRNFGAHPHAIHGLGWQRAWTVVAAQRDRVQLALDHGVDADWPWPFRVTQTFGLARATTPGVVLLTVTLTLANTGIGPFPYGLGWHPFFVADAATTVAFDAQQVWQNDATQLPLRRADVPAAWPFAAARPLAGLAIDTVFTGWPGRVVVSNVSTGVRATLAADRACGNLVVYSPPDAGFIALEPVTHETDAFNRSALGALQTGCRTLPPGYAFSCTMRIAASALQ